MLAALGMDVPGRIVMNLGVADDIDATDGPSTVVFQVVVKDEDVAETRQQLSSQSPDFLQERNSV